MPNSEIEIVPPADGRGETRNFLLVCAGVIATALILLSLIHKTSANALPELPASLINAATQISNAVEEIAMLEEAGLITAPYQLDELPLPTIKGQAFTQQEDDCFSLLTGDFQFIVERHEDAWDAHWTQTEQAVDCHAAITWHTLNQ
ncbi:hypothetical protein [Marinomonas ostreistagni]|uniref:hypothetical protein n=1 Tax=Marinomonas ostreistagni TaxID=359209 RepID=UPI00195155F1|nr:hypothetical protein [Marinomonas ostreistagni]MBM6550963.1 hypothetical protein [Marinomonas ostreistagni]